MSINPAFLLIADPTLDLSLKKSKKNKLKSHLIYSLLFEERIILSDNQIIDNRNFRLLIRDNDQLINALNKDNFTIAFRDYIDVRTGKGDDYDQIQEPNIQDILKGFISWNKFKWTTEKSSNYRNEKNSYESYEDLNYITEKAEICRYYLNDVSSTYARDVVKLFKSESARKILGDQIALTICQLIKSKIDNYKKIYPNPEGGIGLSYFQNDLAKELAEIGLADIWTDYSSKILYIADSPHKTTLPKILSCNPVYGQMHKDKIELVRGTDFSLQEIEEDFSYNSRLLNFEEAISRLEATSILKLRNSPEFNEYRKQLNELYFEKKSIDSIKNALIEYKHRIDDEILTQFPYLKSSRKEKRELIRFLNLVSQTAGYAGPVLSGLAIAGIPFYGIDGLALGAGLISIFASSYLIKKTSKEIDGKRRNVEQHKQKTLNHLQKTKSSIIEAESIISSNNIFKQEVFFKSVI